MKKKVHYLGLHVEQETIAVAIAPQLSTEVRSSGSIGGAAGRRRSLRASVLSNPWVDRLPPLRARDYLAQR